MKEAHEVQKLWMESSQNVNDVNKLVKVWNNRKPWIGDNLTVWSDLVSWRRTFYSFLLSRNTSSEVQQEVHNIKFAWVFINMINSMFFLFNHIAITFDNLVKKII